ncbi:hypothetical protein GVN24_12485 [Rhizobium sp. CRIBSB]|nr:hypothetical protein [Rhizobium sp. CRIBSB]
MTALQSTEFTLTADDHANALKLNAIDVFKRPANLALKAAFIIIFILLFAMQITVGSSIEGMELPLLLLVIGVTCGPFLVAFLLLPIRARWIYKRQKQLHKPITIQWSNEGITATGAEGHWTTSWTDYHRFVADEKMLLFYIGPNLFQMLPRRALSDDQLANIRSHATRISV